MNRIDLLATTTDTLQAVYQSPTRGRRTLCYNTSVLICQDSRQNVDLPNLSFLTYIYYQIFVGIKSYIIFDMVKFF